MEADLIDFKANLHSDFSLLNPSKRRQNKMRAKTLHEKEEGCFTRTRDPKLGLHEVCWEFILQT